MDFFKKAWKGRLSLARAFWIIYILVAFELGFIYVAVAAAMGISPRIFLETKHYHYI
jgi:hypothetical protein